MTERGSDLEQTGPATQAGRRRHRLLPRLRRGPRAGGAPAGTGSGGVGTGSLVDNYQDDATFEPITPPAGGLPGLIKPPAEKKYDPEKELGDARRELARRLLYVLVLVILLHTGLLTFAMLTSKDIASLSGIFETMFAAVVTLVSAATGFYFGARTETPTGGKSP